jgi:hypothetical protein
VLSASMEALHSALPGVGTLTPIPVPLFSH